MIGADFQKRRLFIAVYHTIGATWVETAPDGQIEQVGRTARYRSQPLISQLDVRDAPQQSLRIRMTGVALNLSSAGEFNKLTRIHDSDFVGSLQGNAQIVSYQDQR